MKNIKFNLLSALVAALLLFFNTVNATSITSLKIVPDQKEKAFLLDIKAEGQGTINIEIVDQAKNIIFSDKVSAVIPFRKKFNLKNLDRGSYSLQIEDEFKVTYQPLKVTAQGLEVEEQFRKVSYKPRISFDNDYRQLDINWLMDQRGSYSISIEDEKSRFLFTDHVENSIKIHERYNLSKLPSGVYFLTLKSGDQTHFEKIHVE